MYHAELTIVHCWFHLGHRDMGTEIELEYRRADDEAVSADDFREWVSRIEAVSGMTRNPSRCDVEEVALEPHVLFDYRDNPDFNADSEGSHERGIDDDPLPVVVSGVEISGWDRLGLEMELSIVATDPLSTEDRKFIEELLESWVDAGKGDGFGAGFFRGWIPGEWDDDEYHVGVDSGAQMVDWAAAISDLSSRVASVSPRISSRLAIRLGP